MSASVNGGIVGGGRVASIVAVCTILFLFSWLKMKNNELFEKK